MIIKPERIIKQITKAVGQRQSVLIFGDWQEELIKGIKENQNLVTKIIDNRQQATDNRQQATGNRQQTTELLDNSYTRIIADYNSLWTTDNRQQTITQSSTLNPQSFFKECRRLLLPTGLIIISANSKLWFLEKIFRLIKREPINSDIQTIKPSILQELVHDNGFLIEAYNGYPDGHLLMFAEIQNKEVSTLFSSEKQETIKT